MQPFQWHVCKMQGVQESIPVHIPEELDWLRHLPRNLRWLPPGGAHTLRHRSNVQPFLHVLERQVLCCYSSVFNLVIVQYSIWMLSCPITKTCWNISFLSSTWHVRLQGVCSSTAEGICSLQSGAVCPEIHQLSRQCWPSPQQLRKHSWCWPI